MSTHRNLPDNPTSSNDELPTPDLGPDLIRPSGAQDLERLGMVAAAGFWHEPRWRRNHVNVSAYPHDPILHMMHSVREDMADPKRIVLALVDAYDPKLEASEASSGYPMPQTDWKPVTAGEQVIVGFAVWKLLPGQKRVGQFQNHTLPLPDLPPQPNGGGRDLMLERFQSVERQTMDAKSIYQQPDDFLLSMLSVHPAYWRRGHATRLIKWGLELAAIDRVNSVVWTSAHGLGPHLYKSLNYTEVVKVYIEGDGQEPKPDGFDTLMMRRLRE